jgi:hydroxymethylglutaryl-CoA lyase
MNTLCFEDEVLRDGLQMESRIFSLQEKLTLFELLKKAGIRRIQVGSFVHPGIVPQMADTDELIKRIGRQEDMVITALILNDKGLERALKCGMEHVSMSISISNTHSLKNARRTTEAALESMTGLIAEAVKSGLKVRAGLQCAFGCAYEGSIPEAPILAAAKKMAAAGATEINLADTAGLANPVLIRQLVKSVSNVAPGVNISLHLHDTRGLGLANMLVAYEAGVRLFDVGTGGLGGCPFVKGAAGNVPTEDAVNLFEAMGVKTQIDVEGVCDVVQYLEDILNRKLPSRMKRVLETKVRC